MRRMKVINSAVVFLALFTLVIGCSQGKSAAVLPPYAVKEPLKEARVFEPGNISKPDVFDNTTAISPDGKEFIFQSVREETKVKDVLLYRSRYVDGAWSKAELLPFMKPDAVEGDPALSPDGQTLVFASNRPAPGLTRFNLWKVTRDANGGWGEPQVLGPEINESYQVYPSVAANGDLYFSREKGLFRAIFKDGSYQKAESISQDINGDTQAFMGYIDPDERFLLYFGDPIGIGQLDIWVSYNRNGKWTKGERLSEKVNTDKKESTPYVSPDGKYLFFAREAAGQLGKTDIMQIDLAETGIKLK